MADQNPNQLPEYLIPLQVRRPRAGLRTPPQASGTQLPNPLTLPRPENVAAEDIAEINDRTRFPNIQQYVVRMPPGAAQSRLAVDTPSGRRVLLTIQNQILSTAQAAPLQPFDESFNIGISFDSEATSFDQCPIQLTPGGSIVLDQVIPQNRVYLFSDNQSAAVVDIPVGVTVGNFMQ